MGSPALTTRGFNEEDFKQVAEFVHRGIQLTTDIQDACGSKKLVDFKKYVTDKKPSEIERMRKEVIEFALQFPAPGVDF